MKWVKAIAGATAANAGAVGKRKSALFRSALSCPGASGRMPRAADQAPGATSANFFLDLTFRTGQYRETTSFAGRSTPRAMKLNAEMQRD